MIYDTPHSVTDEFDTLGIEVEMGSDFRGKGFQRFSRDWIPDFLDQPGSWNVLAVGKGCHCHHHLNGRGENPPLSDRVVGEACVIIIIFGVWQIPR